MRGGFFTSVTLKRGKKSNNAFQRSQLQDVSAERCKIRQNAAHLLELDPWKEIEDASRQNTQTADTHSGTQALAAVHRRGSAVTGLFNARTEEIEIICLKA